MADRLPPELIVEIVHHLPMTDAILGVLTQVCSTWRRAITGEPKLWRKFILSSRFQLDRCVGPSRSHIEFDQQRLQRAGPYGLEIVIDDSAIRKTSTRTPSPYNLLDVIMPFYKQWQTLQLSLHLDCYKPLFDLVRPELTMLEGVSLKFNWRYGDAIQLEQQLIKTFDAAPRLKRVELVSGSQFSLPLPLLDRISFPYQRLTTLVLEYVSDANPSVLTQILAVATNLECARFGLGCQSALDYGRLEADEWERRYELYRSTRSFASCPKLVDLEIISQGLIETDFVLGVLTAPALRELRSYHPLGLRLGSALEAFQKRSKAPLRLLHLHYYEGVDEVDLVPFLKLVRETLQELVYDVHDEDDFDTNLKVSETMEMITFPNDTGDFTGTGKSYDPLLPNLKRLGVALYSCPPVVACTFGRVVASRGYADVSLGCSSWLKDWLKKHRLEEVMLYCDDFQLYASVRSLRKQLRSFEEREVDALKMTWCGTGWTRESPKWLPCEGKTNRTFSFDNRG
ncbi:hypothetical protein K435DRAFT_785811 [Dendrothele bispora CBS 962.96]|uniref:F-box domain-containing protein n=1 Tax=Dendrothele bispora (strain CBS 962.96) TaxID=1314807 RepID=A0A4S8KUH6_DENBC|nr:hypothetical protein K435DRAFT_785811 [Dendrothele bispora CBS 962.96]